MVRALPVPGLRLPRAGARVLVRMPWSPLSLRCFLPEGPRVGALFRSGDWF